MKIDHKGHAIVLTQKGDTIIAKVTNIKVASEKDIEEAIAKAKRFVDTHLSEASE